MASRVDELLSRFLAIQKELVSLPCWRYLRIPGLFAAIDFPRHQRDRSLLAAEMEPVQERIPALKNGGGLAANKAEFVGAL